EAAGFLAGGEEDMRISVDALRISRRRFAAYQDLGLASSATCRLGDDGDFGGGDFVSGDSDAGFNSLGAFDSLVSQLRSQRGDRHVQRAHGVEVAEFESGFDARN